MKETPVDGVERFVDFLEHQYPPGEIGLQRRAEQLRKHHHVERRIFFAPRIRRQLAEIKALPRRAAHDQPFKATCHGILATCFVDVDGHRCVHGHANPLRQQPGQNKPAVAIAQKRLCLRRRPHPRNRTVGNAVRPVSAAREPHRIDPGIIGDLDQRILARLIRPGKMPRRHKALRVKRNLGRPVPEPRLRQRIDALGHLKRQHVRRCNNCDLHGQPLQIHCNRAQPRKSIQAPETCLTPRQRVPSLAWLKS